MSKWLLPMVEHWAEWGGIFTNVACWRPVVEHVWQTDGQLHATSGVSVPVRVKGGYPGTCAVFVVDERAVIKFFPPMVARDYDRELAAYRLIQNHVSRVPALLSHGSFRDRIEWPYLVVSYLPGEAWREVVGRVPTTQALAIMSELGRMIRALHAIAMPPSGTWPAASAWESLVAVRLAQAGSDLRRLTVLPESVLDEIEQLLSRQNWYDAPVSLLHSDLTEDHLLVADTGGRWSITGLIDWADAEVGPPAYDWVVLWFSICRRDPALLKAFFHGYGAPVADQVRHLAAMTFLHRFGANIIGDLLPPEDQRALTSLKELNRALFGVLTAVIQ